MVVDDVVGRIFGLTDLLGGIEVIPALVGVFIAYQVAFYVIAAKFGAWAPAELGRVPSDDTWVQWAITVEMAPGPHTLAVRATDQSGYTQTAALADVVPDGEEIVDLRWFERAELEREVLEGTIGIPAGTSIARALIEHWYGSALPEPLGRK